jgi:HD-GYP domain-containing protein (c-di-GMP phosphodiesterase class II)
MKVKINSSDLAVGMYVTELDRPWIESPFLFQGFPINNEEELEQVRQACDYVYVDTEKTPQDIRTKLLALNADNKNSQTSFTQTTFNANKDDAAVETTFKRHLIKAKEVRDRTRQYIDQALEDVRLGASVDTKKAKAVVSSLVDNIVTNQDASIWLTHLKKRDEYTAIHSVNVCILSISFGRSLGLSKDELNILGLGALLHDLGKMRVPLEVLNKPGKLTDIEFEIMRSHPGQGYELLKNDQNIPPEALDVVLGHHERLNGGGYPHGRDESTIPHFTRIVSIVDVYDAITSDRVYHDGMSPHDALKNMYKWAPGNFDQELIEAFIKTIGIYPIGSLVEFGTGHVGMVAKLNDHKKLKPVVMLLLNRNKEPYPIRRMVNLANPAWEQKKSGALVISRIVDAKEYNINVPAILQEETKVPA